MLPPRDHQFHLKGPCSLHQGPRCSPAVEPLGVRIVLQLLPPPLATATRHDDAAVNSCRRKAKSQNKRQIFGCFEKLGVPCVGVRLTIRAPLFGVYLRAPSFWKLPFQSKAGRASEPASSAARAVREVQRLRSSKAFTTAGRVEL